MEIITSDCGIKEFVIGDGVLSFNAADPSVYDRFMEIPQKIKKIEVKTIKKIKRTMSGYDVLMLLCEADRQVKDLLRYVFGDHNDFDKMVYGVNMFAVATNGERVIVNFLDALNPIMEKGVKECETQCS